MKNLRLIHPLMNRQPLSSNSVTLKRNSNFSYKPLPRNRFNMNLTKDFIVPKSKISEKVIDSTYNQPKSQPIEKDNSSKELPKIEYNQDLNNMPMLTNTIKQVKKPQVISGENFKQIVPEVGVRVKLEDESKNGGMNFGNQFGKMSLSEYQKLREHYMGINNSSYNRERYQINSSPTNDNLNDYSYKNNIKYNNNSNTESINSNSTSNFTSMNHSRMNNQFKTTPRSVICGNKISSYNWRENDNANVSGNNYSNGFGNSIISKSNCNYGLLNNCDDECYYNSGNNKKFILNEDLFKNRKYRDIRKEKENNQNNFNYINCFNGNIISNSNWGSVDHRKGIDGYRASLPCKKNVLPSMRKRKK